MSAAAVLRGSTHSPVTRCLSPSGMASCFCHMWTYPEHDTATAFARFQTLCKRDHHVRVSLQFVFLLPLCHDVSRRSVKLRACMSLWDGIPSQACNVQFALTDMAAVTCARVSLRNTHIGALFLACLSPQQDTYVSLCPRCPAHGRTHGAQVESATLNRVGRDLQGHLSQPIHFQRRKRISRGGQK